MEQPSRLIESLPCLNDDRAGYICAGGRSVKVLGREISAQGLHALTNPAIFFCGVAPKVMMCVNQRCKNLI